MNTFFSSLLDRWFAFKKKLDIQRKLCGTSWEAYCNDETKQTFIFNRDGSILVSLNGKVSTLSWKYLSANSSILITYEDKTLMFRPVFYDDVIFVLQQDGVEKFLFMLNENKVELFKERTFKAMEDYFEEQRKTNVKAEKVRLDGERARLEEERAKKIKEQEYKERKKRQEIELVQHICRDNKEKIAQMISEKKKKEIKGSVVSGLFSLAFIICLFLLSFSSFDFGLFIGLLIIGFTVSFIALCVFLSRLSETTHSSQYVKGLLNGKDLKYLSDDEIDGIYAEL